MEGMLELTYVNVVSMRLCLLLFMLLLQLSFHLHERLGRRIQVRIVKVLLLSLATWIEFDDLLRPQRLMYGLAFQLVAYGTEGGFVIPQRLNVKVVHAHGAPRHAAICKRKLLVSLTPRSPLQARTVTAYLLVPAGSVSPA